MDSTISIEIPQEIIHATRMTPRELRTELGIYLFEQGKLSFGKAREMAGMNVWTFQQLLGSRYKGKMTGTFGKMGVLSYTMSRRYIPTWR